MVIRWEGSRVHAPDNTRRRNVQFDRHISIRVMVRLMSDDAAIVQDDRRVREKREGTQLARLPDKLPVAPARTRS
jgi:hypothetical protein